MRKTIFALLVFLGLFVSFEAQAQDPFRCETWGYVLKLDDSIPAGVDKNSLIIIDIIDGSGNVEKSFSTGIKYEQGHVFISTTQNELLRNKHYLELRFVNPTGPRFKTRNPLDLSPYYCEKFGSAHLQPFHFSSDFVRI